MGRVSHDLEEVHYPFTSPGLPRALRKGRYVPLTHAFFFGPANLTCVTAVSCTGMEGEICTAIQQSAPHWDFGLPFSSGGGLGVWGDVSFL